MAKRYRLVDRDQQFLLPEDMRAWLPVGHLVWFVLDVVDQIDTSAFHRRDVNAGSGRAAFDPDMLLALLLYAYCQQVRSSRQIERLCEVDVAFRVICAQDVPDHATIARFRQRNDAGFKVLFVEVLTLAARAGLGRFGTIAIDGTKIAANASVDANRDRDWLRGQVQAILAEADQVDAAEDAEHGSARGDELPPELADPGSRSARIRAALAELDEQDRAEQARAEQRDREQAIKAVQWIAQFTAGAPQIGCPPAGTDQVELARLRLDRLVQAQQAKIDTHRGTGRPPAPVEDHHLVRQARAALARALTKAAEAPSTPQPSTPQPSTPAPARRANTTDPQSRLMPTRRGWIQGYNVQLAVTADQLIVATGVGQHTVDTAELVPMMAAAEKAADHFGQVTGTDTTIGTVLADAGYANPTNLTAPGPDRLIALGKGYRQHRDATNRPARGQPSPSTSPRQVMDHRLRTEAGAALYKRRAATVEPAIGNLKKIIDRFSRRGLPAATGEIDLATSAFNLLKIYRATPTPA